MKLEIVSPEAQLFSGEVSSVTVPGALGSFQILNNHAPIISALDKGTIKVKNGKEEASFTISGGFVEVLNNKLSAMVEE